MSNYNDASQSYLRSAVLTARPEQLQMMLYDGAVKHATQGLAGLRANDREASFLALDRAQRIVLELSNGLNRDVSPELVDQMGALYSFCYRRLVDANVHHDVQAGEEALRVLRHMRETWVLVMEKLRGESAPAAAAPVSTTKPTAPPARAPEPEKIGGGLSLEG